MPDLGAISEGAKQSTGHYELKKLWNMIKGLLPETKEKPMRGEESRRGGDLGEEIAGVAQMMQNPASSSADWDNVYQDWMDGGMDIEDMSEGQLTSIYDELRGFEGQEPETMIEELTTFRDRYYGRR